MVPFYGQGMNAGLEDVRVLFSFLDRYAPSPELVASSVDPSYRQHQRAKALEDYSKQRTPDAHAINDLALQNYTEMRAGVTSPLYRLRKYLEERIDVWVPALGWRTKYARVSFGNERYSQVVAASEMQGKLLVKGILGVLLAPVVVGAITAVWRWKRAYGVTRGALKWQGWFGWITR